MIIQTVNIPSITRDNDAAYLNHVRYTVETIDPNAQILVNKSEEILSFHINPSSENLRQNLIDKLLEYHRKLNIKIEFSKSLAIQKHISFRINFS